MTTKELRRCCVRELPELPEPHEPPPTLPLQLPSFSVQLKKGKKNKIIKKKKKLRHTRTIHANV
jgi:hypothetical protein